MVFKLAQETADLQVEITQCFAEMDVLRERMQREDASIAASRQETLRNLTAIATVLSEIKAA